MLERHHTSTATNTRVAYGNKIFEDVALVEFMYLVRTCMPGESYRRQLKSLLYLCDVFER